MNKIITHNGTFHLDEIFAIACIQLLYKDEKFEIIRTREKDIIKKGDWIVDVGGVYDPENNKFDHHQPDAPVRKNGLPYAAFGLVWRHLGKDLVGDEGLAKQIDTEFVQMIDGPDNGVETYHSLIEGGRVPGLSMLTGLWMSDTETQDDQYESFIELLGIAKIILTKLIGSYQTRFNNSELFDAAYRESADKNIVDVGNTKAWPMDVSQYPETKFVVYQDVVNKTWKGKCITEKGFECRVSFPLSWRGLNGHKLQEVSGFKTAEFVHKGGFLAVAKERAELIEMCRFAIKR